MIVENMFVEWVCLIWRGYVYLVLFVWQCSLYAVLGMVRVTILKVSKSRDMGVG